MRVVTRGSLWYQGAMRQYCCGWAAETNHQRKKGILNGKLSGKVLPDVDDVWVRPVSDTTCWPSTRLMQRTKRSTAMAQGAVTACKAHQHCLVILYKYMVECYIVSVLLRNVTFRSVPISCRLLGLSLPCYALGVFLEHVVPLRSFWRILWTVSVIVLDCCNNFVPFSFRLSARVAGCCRFFFPLRGCGAYWGQIQFTRWA